MLQFQHFTVEYMLGFNHNAQKWWSLSMNVEISVVCLFHPLQPTSISSAMTLYLDLLMSQYPIVYNVWVFSQKQASSWTSWKLIVMNECVNVCAWGPVMNWQPIYGLFLEKAPDPQWLWPGLRGYFKWMNAIIEIFRYPFAFDPLNNSSIHWPCSSRLLFWILIPCSNAVLVWD